MSSAKSSVALIGFMGSGKSTVGPLVAELFEWRFLDLDTLTAEAAGMSVNEVFAAEGEEGWRRRESSALVKTLTDDHLVLGCGGGVVLSEHNRRELRERFVTVYLFADKELIMERIKSSEERPLLQAPDPARKLESLYEQRLPIYESTADLTISIGDLAPKEVAKEIHGRLLAGEWLSPGLENR